MAKSICFQLQFPLFWEGFLELDSRGLFTSNIVKKSNKMRLISLCVEKEFEELIFTSPLDGSSAPPKTAYGQCEAYLFCLFLFFFHLLLVICFY